MEKTTSTESETQTEETPVTGTPGSPDVISETTTELQDDVQDDVQDDAQARIERLKAALKKANGNAEKHRLKANKFDELNAKLENEKLEKLSEKEKLEKKLADLQAKHDNSLIMSQERIRNYEVRLKASQMGIIDPDAAARLLDASEIEYDEDGIPTNIEDLLKAMLKIRPYLVGKQTTPAPTSGGPTNPGRSQQQTSEINEQYVNDVLSGKIPWTTLTPEQRTKVLNYQAQNPFNLNRRR